MASDANSSDETILLNDSDDSPQLHAAEERSPTSGKLKQSFKYLKVLTAQGSGWLASSLIVSNACLGAGILAFPAAFDQAGGVAVAVIMLFVRLSC